MLYALPWGRKRERERGRKQQPTMNFSGKKGGKEKTLRPSEKKRGKKRGNRGLIWQYRLPKRKRGGKEEGIKRGCFLRLRPGSPRKEKRGRKKGGGKEGISPGAFFAG